MPGRDEALRLVEEETAAMGDIQIMQTAPEQAAFLELLVRAGRGPAGDRGWRLHRLQGDPDRPGGWPMTAPCSAASDSERAGIARRNLDRRAGVGQKVEIKVGPAIETIRAPAGGAVV